MQTTKQMFPNDSTGLDPVVGKDFIIGFTEGVNDESALLVDGFKPTQHDLAILARHYYEVAAKIECFWMISQQSGGTDWRQKAFAMNRLGSIEDAIGYDAFERAIKEVREKWDTEFEAITKNSNTANQQAKGK